MAAKPKPTKLKDLPPFDPAEQPTAAFAQMYPAEDSQPLTGDLDDFDKPWFEHPKLTKDEALRLLVDGDAMREHMRRLSRQPFQEVLARMLRAEPSPQAMREFARMNPDKWSRMVRDSAALAGYKDSIEIDANLAMNISTMSDAEIAQQLAKLTNDMRDSIPGIAHVVPDEGDESLPDASDATESDSDADSEVIDYAEMDDQTLLDALQAENPDLSPGEDEDFPENSSEIDDSWLT